MGIQENRQCKTLQQFLEPARKTVQLLRIVALENVDPAL